LQPNLVVGQSAVGAPAAVVVAIASLFGLLPWILGSL
jgi:hypothetical protein